jgi:hypothetical protein
MLRFYRFVALSDHWFARLLRRREGHRYRIPRWLDSEAKSNAGR